MFDLQIERRTGGALVERLLDCLHQQFACHLPVSFFKHFRLSEKLAEEPVETLLKQLDRSQIRSWISQFVDWNACNL